MSYCNQNLKPNKPESFFIIVIIYYWDDIFENIINNVIHCGDKWLYKVNKALTMLSLLWLYKVSKAAIIISKLNFTQLVTYKQMVSSPLILGLVCVNLLSIMNLVNIFFFVFKSSQLGYKSRISIVLTLYCRAYLIKITNDDIRFYMTCLIGNHTISYFVYLRFLNIRVFTS